MALLTGFRTTANYVLIPLTQADEEYTPLNPEPETVKKREFYTQLLHFIRNESAFNLIWGLISGAVQSYHNNTAWNRFDAKVAIVPIIIGGSVSAEFVLNLLPEIHARSIDSRLHLYRHGVKKLLTEITLPSFTSGVMLAPVLYYLFPTYRPETFLLATLGMQAVRQTAMGLADAYNSRTIDLVGEYGPQSPSVALRSACALLALATTAATVAVTLYLSSFVDKKEHNTPDTEACLDAALGGTIGVLSTAVIAGGTLLGKCVYSFFRQDDCLPLCCNFDQTFTGAGPSIARDNPDEDNKSSRECSIVNIVGKSSTAQPLNRNNNKSSIAPNKNNNKSSVVPNGNNNQSSPGRGLFSDVNLNDDPPLLVNDEGVEPQLESSSWKLPWFH